MKTYKATVNILGLSPGDTFSSDDPWYEPYAEHGYLVEVSDAEPLSGDAEGSAGRDEEGDDPEGTAGAGSGEGELPSGQRDSEEEHQLHGKRK